MSVITKKNQAFTIVELLIVIVVIAILAAITIIAFTGIQDRAEVAVLESDLNQAAKELSVASVEAGAFPSDDTDPNDLLTSSSGVTYQYSSTGSTFCLTATRGDKAYYITQNGSPTEGTCDDHSPPVAGGGGSTLTCDEGYIPVPGNSLFGTSDFCVMKYEAKNVGGVATSQASGTPWVSISQTNAITAASDACDACHLITEAEWLTIAHDVLNVASNWTGGSVGSGSLYRGHSDKNPASALAASSSDSNGYEGTGNSAPSQQRRTLTLSNGEVIWDFAGNVYEWTSGQTSGAGNQPGGSGYTWREWSAVSGTGSLTPNPFPGFGTQAASSWTSSHGIGRLLSNSSDTSLRGFLRGGSWLAGSHGGVFALYLGNSPSSAYSSIGFRVAR